jgi:uncharacterized protein YcfJ
MPGPGKTFDMVQTDQMVCKNDTGQQVQGQADTANQRTVGGAVLGAGLGAAIGGAAGNAGAGAAIGAASVPGYARAAYARSQVSTALVTVASISASPGGGGRPRPARRNMSERSKAMN